MLTTYLQNIFPPNCRIVTSISPSLSPLSLLLAFDFFRIPQSEIMHYFLSVPGLFHLAYLPDLIISLMTISFFEKAEWYSIVYFIANENKHGNAEINLT
jgi:hypothetical protein